MWEKCKGLENGDYRKDDGWGYSILIKEGGVMGDKLSM